MRRWLVVILGLFLAGCGGDRPTPTPAPPAAAHRLVVLSPAVSVILQDVGAGRLIVGRHDFDKTLPEIPPSGHQGGIDYETLLALHPTHVFIEWGDREPPDRLVSLAASNGWVVDNFHLGTLEDIVRTTDELQRSFGDADAEAVSAELEEAWARSDKPLGRLGRVLLLGGAGPPAALGPGSFHGQILSLLGATPAVREGADWIELDAEDIIALDPDAIVLVAPREGGAGIGPTGAEALGQLGAIASLDIAAVRTGRVAILDGLNYQTPSTAMGDFARDLRTVLEGWVDESP